MICRIWIAWVLCYGSWLQAEEFTLRFDLTDGPSGWVDAVAFSPDDKLLAAIQDRTELSLWDTRTGEQLAKIDCFAEGIGHGNAAVKLQALAFSPDGTTLAAGVYSGYQTEGSIFLWDVSTPARIQQTGILRGHTDGVTAIAFTPDGETLISAGLDRRITFWNIDRGEVIESIERHNAGIVTLALTADGATLATGDAGEIKLWDVASFQETAAWQVHELFGLAFTPDGDALVVSTADADTEIWNVRECRLLRDAEPVSCSTRDLASAAARARHQRRQGTVLSAAFSHNGALFASGGYSDLGDAPLLLMNVETARE